MNGHERRAAATREAIKDAMLELLGKTPFTYVTISGLCREAKVGRATFYSHYDGLTDVLDELAADAIDATSEAKRSTIEGISQLAQKMRETTDPEALSPFMDLLPVCQRVADNPKYKVLFTDNFVSEYIIMNIYRREREKIVPDFLRAYHLTPEQADKLFLFGIYGAFAVNQSLGWKKDGDWYQIQKALLTFLAGGYDALKQL